MPLNRCLVVVKVADPALWPDVDRRLRALRGFWAPLGAGEWTATRHAHDRALIATLDVTSEGGAEPETGESSAPRNQVRSGRTADLETGVAGGMRQELRSGRTAWWGEDPPAELADPQALLRATDEQLRGLDRCIVIAAGDEERVRLATGTGAPSLVHEARGDGIDAWSTHVTAAALLAHGGVEVTTQGVAEIIGIGACIGDHTHVRGTTARTVGQVIDDGTTRTYFPRQDRWSLIDEPLSEAERALMENLDRRIRGGHPYVALTAGRDSAVSAAALHRLGIPFATFTWGDESWGEVEEARHRAQILGVPHQARDADYRDGVEALERGLAEVRWTEGVAHLAGWGQPRWPQDMTAVVTGAGAEIGRAYYYAWAVRTRTNPRPKHLAALLGFRVRLAHSPAARDVGAALATWFEAAPHHGWEALDVFYGEERMGRWGHAHLSRTAAPWVAPYPVPEVARALLSIPREDRLRMAFHTHMTDGLGFTLPPVPAQRAAKLPPVARRAVGAWRGRNGVRPQPWFLTFLWATRPHLHEHVADALAHPLITDTLGLRWCAETRQGFLDGERFATERALAAAGIAAYAEAAEQLSP